MNLRILTVEAMLVLAKFWLTQPLAAAILASHHVGVAFRIQLQAAYDNLLALDKRRNQVRIELARLTRVLLALDKRYDNLARAIYHYILGLRAEAQDPDEVAFYNDLLDICLPDGLAIVNHSYLDESGAAESLAKQMTPSLRARLETIQLGTQTLDSLCQEWIRVGREIGESAIERARLQAVHAKTGASESAIRAQTLRSHWIQTVQGLDTAAALMELSDSDRETLFAPLLKSVAAAEARAAQQAPKSEDGSEGDSEDGTGDSSNDGDDPEAIVEGDPDGMPQDAPEGVLGDGQDSGHDSSGDELPAPGETPPFNPDAPESALTFAHDQRDDEPVEQVDSPAAAGTPV